MLSVSRKKSFCNVLGPGTRSVIWFAGCSRRCPDCIADTGTGAGPVELISPDELAHWVLGNKGIEGITLSGGEPFEQALTLLARFLKLVRMNSELSVLAYSGYRYEQLLEMAATEEVLQYVDVLIDGEYRLEEDFGQRWRGSENQRFLFLSDRYAEEEPVWYAAKSREIEIELAANGTFTLSGVPTCSFLNRFTTLLAQNNVTLTFAQAHEDQHD
ncbi:MAG: 4Fe-4S single cluster domain-containing protein [Planctomycetia bacterium]|nr:4Fe-4S single cluster domain-containing protein [Planctomycetia bacterium]